MITKEARRQNTHCRHCYNVMRKRSLIIVGLSKQMARKKRNDRGFPFQMWRYGYFAEQIPPCFTTDSFASRIKELDKQVKHSVSTAPANLSIYKNDTSRRIISVPNPYAFACTVKYMYERRRQISKFAESCNSESPITFIHHYHEDSSVVINSEIARTVLSIRSDFKANLRKRIALAMGYRYRLSLDIATFYNTIYTHSVTWAVCGKKEAKRMFPEEAKSSRSDDYHFADELDERIRDQKSKETNGILTGPFTSRIFSEIILAAIDRDLRKRKYVFRRYVDDYKLYFRSEADAQRAIIEVAKVIAEYNLSINQSKIEIDKYPFDIESPMKKYLDDAFADAGVFGALNEANRLYLSGEKGAYKYALKMLRERDVPDYDRDAVLSMLFNINLLDPKYARYIISFLQLSKNKGHGEHLTTIINQELKRSLEEGYEQEVLNLLYFLRQLGLRVEGTLLAKTFELDCDFVDIISLDLWVNHRDLVIRDSETELLIAESIKQLENDLTSHSMDGEHWLLIYEAKIHGLLAVDISKGRTADFFSEMKELGVSFYQPSML